MSSMMNRVELLNAVLDAAPDDNKADGHKRQGGENRQGLVQQHGGEGVGAGDAGQGEDPDQLGEVQAHVLDTVGAQHRVEAEDEQGGDDRQEAQEGTRAPGHILVADQHALAAFPADGQLREHNGEAHQHRQNQVDHQEGKAAAGAHLVGKAPDVAQTYSGSHSSHQEAQVAAPLPAIVFHKITSYFSNFTHSNFQKNEVAGYFIR